MYSYGNTEMNCCSCCHLGETLGNMSVTIERVDSLLDLSRGPLMSLS